MTPEERLSFLQERQSGIGGSDVAAILGLDEYRNAMDVYLDKTRAIRDEDVLTTNIHMLRGQLLEDTAATLFCEETGLKVRRMGQRTHPKFDPFRVNADRQILAQPDGRGTGALECKAPAFKGFDNAIQHGVRDQYIIQLQWAMYVCGYQWGEMALCNLEHAAGPLLHFPVQRSETLIAHMEERCAEFWYDHVDLGIPPDMEDWTEAPVEIVKLAGELVTVTDEEFGKKYFQLARVTDAIKKGEAKKKELSAELLAWMRKHEVAKALVPDMGKATLITKKGRKYLNEKQLERSRPIDRDKLLRFMDDEESVAVIEKGDLDLDMDTFRKQADDYEYVGIYPQKESDA